MTQNIRKNSRHVRWNYHPSDETNADGNQFVRYHFVIVDDRDREGILGKILEGLTKYSESILVRREEGKVRDSEYRYLFCSYDSIIKPEFINWRKVNKPVKRDFELRERTIGNLEDYVSRTYS